MPSEGAPRPRGARSLRDILETEQLILGVTPTAAPPPSPPRSGAPRPKMGRPHEECGILVPCCAMIASTGRTGAACALAGKRPRKDAWQRASAPFRSEHVSNQLSRWAAAVRSSTQPAYIAIAEVISSEIQSGRLPAHQKLPTLRELAKALRLNFATVARGYAEAQRRGLIRSRAGSGTFVREVVGSGLVRRPAPAAGVDMTMNMPPEPTDRSLQKAVRDGLAALAQEADPFSWLRYQEQGGAPEDREAAVRWLARYVPGASSERVLVCPGIQSTLLALCFILAPQPGDAIACEAITYPGLKGIAAQLGIRLVGLPADDDGIDPEAFAALCASDLPKALYVNPTLNNPTTAVLTQARREALVEIACRYSVPIIEDDPYGVLPARRPDAIAALAPELTFYLTGLAKCVGAGLRVAYIVTPNARYTARLSGVLRTTTVMAAPLLVRLASRWIDDGTAMASLLAIREESRLRQQMAAQILRKAQYRSRPEAFHLWLTVPESWHPLELPTYLRACGVAAVPADTFTMTGPPPPAVRICLGGPASREECRHNLQLIEDSIEHPPTLQLNGA